MKPKPPASYPTDADLLRGVARFLTEDVRAVVQDPALRFRLLVAANMIRMAGAGRAAVASSSKPSDDSDIEALTARLREELRIVNPRFDVRDDIDITE